jgi:hypothetical protein
MTLTKTLRKTYQLKIGLNGSKPPIWRRFLIANSATLPELHMAIQIIMGWTNSHLHQFIVGDSYYGMPDPDFDMDLNTIDESQYRISQLLKTEKDSIVYEYDFGDGWEHKITLEKILTFDPKQNLPFCIKAKGACPPEDVGGIWGYYDFLEAINDSKHSEHQSYKEWIGDDFDSDAYDIEETNKVLTEYCR